VIAVSENTGIEVGIDSFAAAYDEASLAVSPSQRLRDLVEQIEHADQVGLDVFGIGEHQESASITGRTISTPRPRSFSRRRRRARSASG